MRERYAEGCVTYDWRGLGQQLLWASGATEAELEGDGTQQAAAGHGSVYSESAQEGVWVDLPADAMEQMQVVWHHYSSCLFYALQLYEGELLGDMRTPLSLDLHVWLSIRIATYLIEYAPTYLLACLLACWGSNSARKA
mgnify:CR=1 FL=1